jgi:Zn finger protein HypA/HybF involved in hydrogenase expression
MDAITMRSMSSLIHKLKTDFPEIIFFETDTFLWSPSTKTVSYSPDAPHASALVLHEISHALLHHDTYQRDVQLLGIEAAAWDMATQLAKQYRIKLSETVAQDHLDTYRDWMHARSTCPECTATGYQTAHTAYTCPACAHEWRVNEARVCGLKRYAVKR